LAEVLDLQADPVPQDPFELILWENVAYLVDDARRAEAMARLRSLVGTDPIDVLRAPLEVLRSVAAPGILPHASAEKLRRASEIAMEEFEGDVNAILDLPLPKAKQALRRFPGIGEPGAEKILLYSHRYPSLAPDSNALRVLVRLGYIEEKKSYSATYASAREAAREQLGDDCNVLLQARRVLRQHGRVTCRNSTPQCDRCPLRDGCAFGSSRRGQDGHRG
jgi:endonuclease III